MRQQLCLFTLLLAFTFGLHQNADAARVSKVNGKKILLETDGESMSSGDLFFLLDSSGKKKGLIKIKAVKGTRALGLLGKGKAEIGWTTQASRGKGGGSSDTTSTASSAAGKSLWGIIGGIAMDTMKVKVDNTGDSVNETSVTLKGNAFSIKGLFDMNLFEFLSFRGLFGVEGLNASGSKEVGCSAGKTCSATIYYLAGDFWGRLGPSSGNVRPWGGMGFSLMFPLSKSATALEEKSITNTSSIAFGGGLDIFTSPTFAIPIQVEYILLPKSQTVEASAIAARVGVMFPF